MADDKKAPSHAQKGTFLARAYDLGNADEARNLYDEWAMTYTQEMDSLSYIAPQLAAKLLVKHLPKSDPGRLSILDAGCGTGSAGVALDKTLQQQGTCDEVVVDGVDISPGMLEQARQTGAYAALSTADLSRPLPDVADGAYDAVICVGTLTHGHVGPAALAEFVRIVKARKGLVVATVLEHIWKSGGYEAEVERLTTESRVEVVSKDIHDYTVGGEPVLGRILVLRKL